MNDLLSQNEKLELTILSAWLGLSGTGLCAVDNTSRVVMLNPAACEILGIDGLDMLNQPLRKLLDGLNIDDPSLLQWLCTPGFDGERDVTRTDQNGIIQILMKSSTHRAQESGMFKIIAITDVTELRTAKRHMVLTGQSA
jgi:PAS domain S-box-containing protein